MEALDREVGVFVRVRPTADFAYDLIQCLPDEQTVNIRQRRDSRKPLGGKRSQLSSWSFHLDGVLQNVSQQDVYNRVCRHVMLGALEGYNGTVICFGQTGAGKTYTMTGSSGSYEQRGVVPRALQELFEEVQKRTDRAFSVHLSYLEIYNENMVDLLPPLRTSPHLHPRGMAVMEEPGGGVFIRGLSLHPVHNEEEALHLLFEGEMNRIIGSHSLNRRSSRSHCVLTVHVESRSRSVSEAKYITSKLNLVDLAGSERLGKTGSEGQMLKEAGFINKSLSFLEQAILALADCRRDHVPFRQSKLTHALKDSLSGNCNVVLVANIYAEAAQIEETLSTLRFASRMKCVQTRPVVNEQRDPAAQVKKLEKEVQMLKDELSIFNTANGRSSRHEPPTEAERAEIQSQVQSFLDGSLEGISITSIRHVQAVFAQFKQVVQMQEQTVKAQQRQIYDLLNKNQSADMKEWDTSGRPEPQEQTEHPTSAKAASKKSKVKQSQSKRQGEDTPVSKQHLENSSKSKPTSVQESDPGSQEMTESHAAKEPVVYGAPPLRPEAFEDFKKGQGSKINIIFKENRAILQDRRVLLNQLKKEVDDVKRAIDGITADLQRHERREGQDDQYTVRDGDAALQEPDDSLLVRLGELKARYRQRYKSLSHIKAEVNYCQHLVDQCRVRLHSEFESWYKRSFLSPEDNDKTTPNTNSTQRNSRAKSFSPQQKKSS